MDSGDKSPRQKKSPWSLGDRKKRLAPERRRRKALGYSRESLSGERREWGKTWVRKKERERQGENEREKYERERERINKRERTWALYLFCMFSKGTVFRGGSQQNIHQLIRCGLY